MKPYTPMGIVRVTRLIPVLIAGAALCACSGTRSLSAGSDTVAAGSTPAMPTQAASFVGINVLVSGLESGASLQFSVNGDTVSSGVIDANGNTSVPGNQTQLVVGSTYSFAITVQPQDELCAAANASGTIGSTIAPNITVTCVADATAAAASETSRGIKSTPSHTTPQARQGAASWTDP